MNILHISSGNKGGAKLAANRLIRAQILNGDRVTLISQSSQFTEKEVTKNLNFLPHESGIIGKSLTVLQKAVTKDKFGVVSTLSVSRLNIDHISKIEPEVIHIHNWFNLLNFSIIPDLLRIAPIVFTLHDQRLFTGGCHYSHDCQNNLINCGNCPAVWALKDKVKKNREQIIRTIGTHTRIGFVAPSNWILDQIVQALPNCNEALVRKIPNVLDEASYSQPKPNINNSNLIKIAFVAAQPINPIKGLSQLISALQIIYFEGKFKEVDIELHIFGDPKGIPDSSQVKIYRRGLMSSIDLTECLNGFDLAVVPSFEDNSPSVIGEFQLRKIFVIGTNVGGIKERVKNYETGLLCEPSPAALSKSISAYLNLERSQREEIIDRAFADAKHNYKVSRVLKEHYELYKELESQP